MSQEALQVPSHSAAIRKAVREWYVEAAEITLTEHSPLHAAIP